MCYAIPGKVKEIHESIATIDYFGEERKAHNEIPNLKVGDYVYAQGGYVIRTTSEGDAKEVLAAWKEMFFELQKVDLRLSRVEKKREVGDEKMGRILDRALEGRKPTRKEVQYLLECENTHQQDILFSAANFLRQKQLKNSCCVHGILEISNYCTQGCQYCGIGRDNKKLLRYRMSPEEIVSAAYEAVETYGFKALVLQSGEDSGITIDELAWVIKTIKEKSPALIFISFGEVGLPALEKLYHAGARGLLMRFETSNEALYKKIHPGRSLDTRLHHIRAAYERGYLIITGGLIGLPGQTRDDIINDLYLTEALHTEMYSFGPFLPHSETPLKDQHTVSESDVLKTLAVARLMSPPESKILITTAFETLSTEARRRGLLAGGNSVMLNVTPAQYRDKYDIYPDRAYMHDPVQKQIDETLSLLRALGRAPTDLGVKS